MYSLAPRPLTIGLTASATGAFAVVVAACVGDAPSTSPPITEADASVVDGSFDAAAGADAAPLSFCKTDGAHDFCADFDDQRPADTVGFTLPEVAGNGQPPIVVADVGTPRQTGALKAMLERGATTVGYHAARWNLVDLYATGATRKRVKIAFDLYIERADANPYGAYMAVLGDPSFTFFLEQVDGGTELSLSTVQSFKDDGGAPIVSQVPELGVPMRTWTRLTIAVTPRAGDPSPASLTLTVGGQAKTYTFPSASLPSQFAADIGIATGDLGGGWTVYYDNVTMDWK